MAAGGELDTTVTLEGNGVPYLLDTFTGKITPIANYTKNKNTITVRVQLARDASTVIALSTVPHRFSTAAPSTHAVATTADSVVAAGSSLLVRASKAGAYTTTLDNGRRVTTKIPAVTKPLDLTTAAWSLRAEDWQPANPYGTTGEAGTATTKKPVTVPLSQLKAWPQIPELANASGVGYYSTTVNLPSGWSNKDGANLSLGQVTDTFTLTVNGHPVPIDQISAKADAGAYLHAGANTIAVRVATTLNNRLAALDTSVKNRGVIQNYGLAGPVTLTPYRQEVVVGRR